MAGLPTVARCRHPPAVTLLPSPSCRRLLLPALRGPPFLESLLTVVVLVPRPTTTADDLRELAGRVRRVGRARVEEVLVAQDGSLPDVEPGSTVVLVDGDWAGHDHALRLLTRDERRGVRAAGGLLSVDPAHRDDLAAAVAGAGTLGPDAVAACLEELGVPLLRPVPAGLVSTVAPNAAARAAVDADCESVDEEDVRLRSAVKSADGVFTSVAISPWSRHLARWFARRHVTPDAVTWLALLVTLAATASFGTGLRVWMVVGAVLLELSFALDCVDGQLARYAVSYSERGAWLDAALDRFKEFVVYAGLAYGAARHGMSVWLLATLAIALQTARHTADFGFHLSAVRRETPAGGGGADGGAAGGGGGGAGGGGGELFTGRLASSRAVALRRVVALPIGERWLLIAVLAALTDARVVFVALLVLGLLAGAWTVGGRVLRARRRPVPFAEEVAAVSAVLEPMADVAPTPTPQPRGAALVRWWWLVPAVLRVVEYAGIGLLGALLSHDAAGRHAPAAAFALVLVVAQRHYDVVYRLTAVPRLPVWPPQAATLGVVGRLVLVWVAAFGGGRLGVVALVALAVWVGACVLAGAGRRFRETAPRRARQRLGSQRRGPQRRTQP